MKQTTFRDRSAKGTPTPKITSRSVARTAAGLLAGVVVTGASVGWAAAPAAASTRMPEESAVSYTAAAAAPVAQITEDEPTAQFHPEGDGDYGYTLVTDNGSGAGATAALIWPGAPVAHAGTLVGLLGGPDLSAFNDPVQASAPTATSDSASITAPTGTTMSASVSPQGSTDRHTTATSTLAGGGLGAAGSIGHATSTSTIDFTSATGDLKLTAASQANHVDVAGVVRIGSVTSSATAETVAGGAPALSGSTVFQDMTVAGQQAYVDSTGVHMGAPGQPTQPAQVDMIDAALAQAGMEVYFTKPHTITVGEVSYYYAASVIFFWAPPGDTNHNTFSMTLGGAAVSVTASSNPFATLDQSGGSGTGSDTAGSSAGAATTSPSSASAVQAAALTPAPTLTGGGVQLAAPGPSSSDTGGASSGPILSLPASNRGGSGSASVPASVTLPGGIGVGWWVLAVLVGLLAAGLTTRVPALLNRQAASACPRARNPRSTIGQQKEMP